MSTLAEHLINEVDAEHSKKRACIESNRARIEAFEAMMRKLGGDHQRVGGFVESVVVHSHTCNTTLRLQLCAEGASAKWIEANLADLEARIGHTFHPFIRRGDSATSAFLYSSCGTVDIVVSGSQHMAESRFKAETTLEAAA